MAARRPRRARQVTSLDDSAHGTPRAVIEQSATNHGTSPLTRTPLVTAIHSTFAGNRGNAAAGETIRRATLLHRVTPTAQVGPQALYLLLATLAVQHPAIAASPSFVDLGSSGLPNVKYSSAAWGDYDGDGDLDILLSGKAGGRTADVYQNVSGTFSAISAGLAEVERSVVAWGDYDNDGDLDILITGLSNTLGYISKVYRNDGGGTFTDISAPLVGVKTTGGSSAAWGDYDNDGDLDILLAGSVSLGSYVSKVYRNDSGTFNDISAGLPGVSSGSARWGDYDNDGDLDILLVGPLSGGSTRVARVYRNDSGTFSDISAGLTGVSLGSAAWGDYDNDGDLDILLAGASGSGKIAKVFRNDSGTFTDISATLLGVDFSSVAWGDYDNDGDLDILFTGRDGGNAKHSKIFENTGGSFSDASAGLTGVYDGSVAWGDYDADGDLDILLTGDTGSGGITRVYRNDTSTANAPPNAPTGLTATALSNTSMQLSWTAPSDGQTPTNGLSYNLRVGTTPGGSDVFSTMADSSDGERWIAARGPIQGTSYPLANLTPGVTYYWSVQAVDTAFAGSPFATEASLTTPQFTDLGSLGLIGLLSSSVSWGDFDNDGDLDVLTTGFNGSNFSRVYRNDSGTFVDITANLVGVAVGSAAWGDYDNDGDLDILLTGRDASNNPISKLYRNDSGTFTDTSAPLIAVRYSSVAWGDYDNDGDLDILLAGRDAGGTNRTKIYRNDGSDLFTDISASVTAVALGSVAWGDFDNDGDLDILLAGYDASSVRRSQVLRNDGTGGFTDISAPLLPLVATSAAWGDYDNDGDLDILLTGIDGGGGVHSLVYTNDGSGGFSDLSAGLAPVQYGSVAWGDYDNDGDLDILLTGRSTGSARITRIYRNDGGSFTDTSANVTGVDFSSVAWGDYDNDGDLDILLSGRDPGGALIARVYLNQETTANRVPDAPSGMTQTANSTTSATLSWTAPSDQTPTPSGTGTPTAGLSYNLRVGTTLGGSDVLGPMAFHNPSPQTDGLRKIAQRGLVQTTSWRLDNLTPGQTYYWSVQAIDTALAGSSFATETTFATPLPEADLAITKTDGPDPVIAGTHLTYTLNVGNAGPTTAQSVALGDTLPAGTTFVSLTPAAGWSCTTPAVGSGGAVACSIASLPPGGLAAFALTVAVGPSVAQNTVLSNTASVSSTNPDPDDTNDSATAETTVHTLADLSLSKTDSPDPVAALGTLTYTLGVHNAGPSDAQSVVVSDTLPAGVTLVSTSGCAEDRNGVPTCTLGTLAAGGDAQYTIEVTVDAPLASLTLTNDASVGSSTTDPTPGNNEDSAETTANDGSGIDPAVEAQVPGYNGSAQGDGDGNGVQDNLEPWTASIPSVVGDCWFTVTNLQQYLIYNVVALAPPANPLIGAAFPCGMLSYQVALPAPGAGVDIEIYMYPPRASFVGLGKSGPFGTLQLIAPAPANGGAKSRFGPFRGEDGGRRDDDGQTDGVFSDPVGPIRGNEDPSGVVNPARPVPTLLPWGLGALGALLGFFGYRMRGRRK